MIPPAPSHVPAVCVDRAVKTFPGGARALDGATLSVAAGQRKCLLGPNGAGKTTLLRLITGALEPTSGTVQLFGAAPGSHDFLAARRRVGVVPQAPGMYRDLTAGEYLALVERLYRRGSVRETAEAFGLTAYLARPMAVLSGGYQRRLALAAAVLPEPELLLLDEPTAGLDPVAARDVHDRLRVAMAGRAALLCTHNLTEAEALCDAVTIVRGGRVLRDEPIADLRARARPVLVLRAAQGPEAILAALAAAGHPEARAGGGPGGEGTVHLPCDHPEGYAPAILRALLAAGVDVFECRPAAPTLEDLFLETLRDGEPSRD